MERRMLAYNWIMYYYRLSNLKYNKTRMCKLCEGRDTIFFIFQSLERLEIYIARVSCSKCVRKKLNGIIYSPTVTHLPHAYLPSRYISLYLFENSTKKIHLPIRIINIAKTSSITIARARTQIYKRYMGSIFHFRVFTFACIHFQHGKNMEKYIRQFPDYREKIAGTIFLFPIY